jgi:hypothetical protein
MPQFVRSGGEGEAGKEGRSALFTNFKKKTIEITKMIGYNW